MAEQQERTEQATPRRRQKAREKGQMPRSRELSTAAGMAGLLLVVHYGGSNFMYNIKDATAKFLAFQYGQDPFRAINVAMLKSFMMLLPFFLGIMICAVASELFQVGFALKPYEPKLSRLNPITGIGKLFSSDVVVEFIKSFMKFLGGGLIFYYIVKRDIYRWPLLMTKELGQLVSGAYGFIANAMVWGLVYLLIIAAASYAFARWQFEKSIRMSKEEIKEEFKEAEGDPKIKSRIRSIQREQARRRMMAEVPKATVVITNPTHLAIALLYQSDKMSAPKIIAKGSGYVAEKIREIARENRIPLYEDKPLARALFAFEIGEFVPQDLYKAVAKILAYIYQLKGKVV
ncbi:flagellar biosynthesis protein FlhB [Candidatus Magnetominusculus xianensis]|uniref:Flagellar biosynthetic protein FlhB n=1 Tax=Candidatus Magnetominusculus xianensis TaxID=1748249 RepID=A0ABR5SE47_9BACT|nr:flagellar biosynthesis protein FlhB [Candidatus Magnetominusculus xianensis]KWT84087.1 flagellar biosynthetic protein FlhB [Candidatus Magnetominusculus xianensis]MBF0402380.1 flagellar biosynthesis protein FlhB [Nitrospirota bacterium]